MKSGIQQRLLALRPCCSNRLAAYAALAAACAGAPSAEADIIWSGAISINIPSSAAGIYLNVVTGVSGTSAAAVPGWDFNAWGSSALNLTSVAGVAYVGSGNEYFNLPSGTPVGPGSSFTSVGVATNSPSTPLNPSSSANMIGFSFLNETTGQTNYGWIRISLAGTSGGQPRSIVEYFYENSGAPIPEPGTTALLSLLAAGAIGVRVWRRRKRAQ